MLLYKKPKQKNSINNYSLFRAWSNWEPNLFFTSLVKKNKETARIIDTIKFEIAVNKSKPHLVFMQVSGSST